MATKASQTITKTTKERKKKVPAGKERCRVCGGSGYQTTPKKKK